MFCSSIQSYHNAVEWWCQHFKLLYQEPKPFLLCWPWDLSLITDFSATGPNFGYRGCDTTVQGVQNLSWSCYKSLEPDGDSHSWSTVFCSLFPNHFPSKSLNLNKTFQVSIVSCKLAYIRFPLLFRLCISDHFWCKNNTPDEYSINTPGCVLPETPIWPDYFKKHWTWKNHPVPDCRNRTKHVRLSADQKVRTAPIATHV